MPIVPIVAQPYHIICVVLSMFPGVGTVLAGALTSDYTTIAIGIAQWLLGLFWLTWPVAIFWSFCWGILIFETAEKYKIQEPYEL